jgi:hypothetical protein
VTLEKLENRVKDLSLFFVGEVDLVLAVQRRQQVLDADNGEGAFVNVG